MFKKPGSAIGRLSTAVSPAGGGGASTIAGDLTVGIYLSTHGGWLAGYADYVGISHGLIIDELIPQSAGFVWSLGTSATRDDTWSTKSFQSYDGRGNTYIMAQLNRTTGGSPNGFPAAHRCAINSTAGFRDWYLPAADEFIVIGNNNAALTAAGYVMPAGAVATSHQSTSTLAVLKSPVTGAESTTAKNNPVPIIPVRRVPVRT